MGFRIVRSTNNFSRLYKDDGYRYSAMLIDSYCFRYAEDARSSALFHYRLAGDERLGRQSIVQFAASLTAEGLLEARYPSHFVQIITGFSLFWVMSVCDHYWYFADKPFARRFIPMIDAVLSYFDSHVGEKGLVQGFPVRHWLFVDWVAEWEGDEKHDPGVPLAGRENGIYTFFSLLYAYTLGQAAELAERIGREELKGVYLARKAALVEAVRKHCYDGRFYTDSLSEIVEPDKHYSQHCQIFAVLAGAETDPAKQANILEASYFGTDDQRNFWETSYVMKFYALRAFSIAGIYDRVYQRVLEPWRGMLAKNLSTWEEDWVTSRSDCHAWSSTPLYELTTEVAGLTAAEPGWQSIIFSPRIRLYREFDVEVPIGARGVARVQWQTDASSGKVQIHLTLPEALPVQCIVLDGELQGHGRVKDIQLQCTL